MAAGSFRLLFYGLGILSALWAEGALAANDPSNCVAIASNRPAVVPASFDLAQVETGSVKITYVGHSAFRIETAAGISIVTDYSGSSGGVIPDVVTMNHAHVTHFTDAPDPAIKHVLRGWNQNGPNPVRHYLQIGDVLIRNVATDLYSSSVLIEENGNSIFIFEVAGLCLGHLGHLHHKLTPEHIAAIGRIDVLFAPVDGNYTISLAGMTEIATQLRSSLVIPMHYFSVFTLERFIAGMSGKFKTELAGGSSITVSLKTLPAEPTVMVLSPY